MHCMLHKKSRNFSGFNTNLFSTFLVQQCPRKPMIIRLQNVTTCILSSYLHYLDVICTGDACIFPCIYPSCHCRIVPEARGLRCFLSQKKDRIRRQGKGGRVCLRPPCRGSCFASVEYSNWKQRLNSSFSSKSTEAKELTRQAIEHILPPKQT